MFALSISFCPPLDAAEPVPATSDVLLLDVRFNGRLIGKIGEFSLVDGQLFAQASELRELGLKLPESAATTASRASPKHSDQIALATLPGLTYRLDLAAQTIALTVANDGLVPTVLRSAGVPLAGVKVESGTGAALDYDMTVTSSGGRMSGAGLLDLRGFSPWGIASTSVLMRIGGRDTVAATRLDSTYTLSDTASLRRILVGDLISGSLAWTRPVRLGGAQVSLDFSLRPDLITFPLPSVSGSAAVPSTVDVLVNGTRLFSRDIEAGPFEVPQLPVVTGAGTISTTLTNALGRQVSTTLPFYASAALLTPGLQAFSVQAGTLRRNFGLRSNDYRQFAASATYRRGLSDAVTVEAAVETTAHIAMAGLGTVVNVDNVAVINGSAAFSRNRSTVGKQFAVGIQRSGTVLSLAASVSIADKWYRDLASSGGDPIPRLQVSASAGLALGRRGSVGIAYIGIDSDAALIRDGAIGPMDPAWDVDGNGGSMTDNSLVYWQPAQKTHVVSASYSVQIRRLSLSATGFGDLGSGNAGMLAGLALPFGRRGSAAVNAGSGSDGGSGQVQMTQAAVDVGDWGYQAVAGSSSPAHQFAEVRYKAPWSLVSAGIDRSGRDATIRAQAQGSISAVGGGVFASNTIYDSFAVVDTNGFANVRVRSENRDVGVTDGGGRLLVPDLRAFELNHLSIEATELPADATIDVAVRDVRPQDRSGIVVRFPIAISRAALLRIVDRNGAPIPLGSTARLTKTGDVVPVGFDGQAYFADLAPHNEVVIEVSDGRRCIARFDYRAKAGDIPVLGPLKCVEAAR